MKVILQQDVKNLGKKGQVIEVKEGYARNFLVPRKLAVLADEGNMKNLQHKQAVEAKKRQEELEHAQELAGHLKDLVVEMKTRTGEGGRLFGSISTKEIAETIAAKYGYKLDKRKLDLKDPIKALGTYVVHAKLHAKVAVDFRVHVQAE